MTEELRRFLSKEDLDKEIESIKKESKMKSIMNSQNSNNYSSILNVSDLKGKNYVLYDQNLASKKPPPPPLVTKQQQPQQLEVKTSKRVAPPPPLLQQAQKTQTYQPVPNLIIKEKRINPNQTAQIQQQTILNNIKMYNQYANNDVVYYNYEKQEFQYPKGQDKTAAEFEPRVQILTSNNKKPIEQQKQQQQQQPQQQKVLYVKTKTHNVQNQGDFDIFIQNSLQSSGSKKGGVITNLENLIFQNHAQINKNI
jgi:hypothetical protein